MLPSGVKRENRGLNMSALIHEAVQQGDSFWTNEDWKEDEEGAGDSDDSSFEEEEVKPDLFDSDFNDTEESDDENEEGSGNELEKNKKTVNNKYKEPVKKKQIYQEPKPKTVKTKTTAEVGPFPKKRKLTDGPHSPTGTISSRVRQSTKRKTQEAETIRKLHALAGNFKTRDTQNVKKQEFTQRQMLEEALETEQVNAKWLRIQQMAEEEQARVERPVQNKDKQLIRHYSHRGTYPTISFVNIDEFPELFRQQQPVPRRESCSTHGKYIDRVTGLSYNTPDEFRALRKKAGVPWRFNANPVLSLSR